MARCVVTAVATMPTMDSNITAVGTILGTLLYMAPEQLEGNEGDAQTDIFAFGAVSMQPIDLDFTAINEGSGLSRKFTYLIEEGSWRSDAWPWLSDEERLRFGSTTSQAAEPMPHSAAAMRKEAVHPKRSAIQGVS
jgi:serine/threonine protein kinase